MQGIYKATVIILTLWRVCVMLSTMDLATLDPSMQ